MITGCAVDYWACRRLLGCGSIIVLGQKEYYPKFGFQRASRWDIKCPFEVLDEVFMAIELTEKAFQSKVGTVESIVTIPTNILKFFSEIFFFIHHLIY